MTFRKLSLALHTAALLLSLSAAMPAAAAAAASPLVLGAPATTSFCAPITCTLRYQQVLAGRLFSGPLAISELTFYDTMTPGVLPANDFTIRLSTARRGVGAITEDFAGNIGADVQTFFTGSISGAAAPSFSVFGTTFNYNPAAGDLLIDITRNTPAADVRSLYFDASQRFFPGSDYVATFNYDFYTDLVRSSGLTLGFNTSLGAPGGGGGPGGLGGGAVPEPAAWALMILGFGGVGATLRARRRFQATTA